MQTVEIMYPPESETAFVHYQINGKDFLTRIEPEFLQKLDFSTIVKWLRNEYRKGITPEAHSFTLTVTQQQVTEFYNNVKRLEA